MTFFSVWNFFAKFSSGRSILAITLIAFGAAFFGGSLNISNGNACAIDCDQSSSSNLEWTVILFLKEFSGVQFSARYFAVTNSNYWRVWECQINLKFFLQSTGFLCAMLTGSPVLFATSAIFTFTGILQSPACPESMISQKDCWTNGTTTGSFDWFLGTPSKLTSPAP